MVKIYLFMSGYVCKRVMFHSGVHIRNEVSTPTQSHNAKQEQLSQVRNAVRLRLHHQALRYCRLIAAGTNTQDAHNIEIWVPA